MKRPAIFICLLLIMHGYCYAQDITVKEAEEAKLLLKTSKQDTNRVTLLQKAGRFYIEKPGEHQADLDSALGYIQEAEKLSEKLSYHKGIAYSYFLYAIAYREKGEREKGKAFASKAIEVSTKYDLMTVLGESLLEYSNYYDFQIYEQLLEKINLTRRAAISFQQDSIIEKQAFSLKNLGELLAIADSIPQAITVLKKSLSLYKSIHYPRLHGVYDMLGVLHAYIGDHQTGLEFGLLAEKTAHIVQDTSMQLCTIYNRIGLTHYRLNDHKRACHYFLKAYSIAEKYHNISSLYQVQSNLIRSYLILGRTDESLDIIRKTVDRHSQTDDKNIQLNIANLYLAIYMAKKNYVEAQKYCFKVLELFKKPGIDLRLNHKAYANAVDFFLASKQYNQAEHYLKVHQKIIETDDAPFNISKNYLQWFKLDSARGNYISAMDHYQHYRLIEDSLYNLNKTKQIETLTLEYETAKKDQDIKLKEQNIDLLTKQTEVQQSEIQKSKIIQTTTLVSILLLGTIIGLLYNQYRIKQKTNKQLQQLLAEKEHLLTEKEWLLKEVHHRVKNNLQTVLSLLESQAHNLSNDALIAIRESQNRVYAMSLIHKKLYQATDVASINIEEYLKELIQHLRESFSDDFHVSFNQSYEPILLDVSQAVPIGLIVNEAVTNAFKYAFSKHKINNTIWVECKTSETNEVILTIADNGRGLPADFYAKKRNEGLGLKLIRGLAEDIEGKLNIRSENGMSIRINFKATPTLNEAVDKYAILSESTVTA